MTVVIRNFGWLLLVWGLGTGATPAQSTYPVFATAATLKTWCLGKGAVRASCLGYLAGVVDSLREPRPAGEAGRMPCLPASIAVEQVRLIFLNHVHRHPDHTGRGGAAQVRQALADVFPCATPDEAPPGHTAPERISGLPVSLSGSRM